MGPRFPPGDRHLLEATSASGDGATCPHVDGVSPFGLGQVASHGAAVYSGRMENDLFEISTAGDTGRPLIVLKDAHATRVLTSDAVRRLILRLQTAVDRAEH